MVDAVLPIDTKVSEEDDEYGWGHPIGGKMDKMVQSSEETSGLEIQRLAGTRGS